MVQQWEQSIPESPKAPVASFQLCSPRVHPEVPFSPVALEFLLPQGQGVSRETEYRLPPSKPAISLALQSCLQGACDAINRQRPSLCDLVQASLRGALGCLKAKSPMARLLCQPGGCVLKLKYPTSSAV